MGPGTETIDQEKKKRKGKQSILFPPPLLLPLPFPLGTCVPEFSSRALRNRTKSSRHSRSFLEGVEDNQKKRGFFGMTESTNRVMLFG